NDALAMVGCPQQPFQKLNTAIGALLGMVGPTSPGLVHANPGVYSPTTNGESLPVVMRDWIHVQGTGARQCIIRGTPDQSDTMQVFLPDGDCDCGFLTQAEVLVGLSILFNATDEEMIDGFTFQGGFIQVYSRNEATTRASISNCI